jgi:hypothetical protein
MPMKSIDKTVELSAQTTRNVFKRNLTRFAAVLLAALAGLVAGPNAALAVAPQHHDQVPGFYRLKVGDLEVTALFDGFGVFDQHWLKGTKATMDTQDGKRVFPNADVYVAKAESDFWLSPEIAATAPKEAQEFFQSAHAIAGPYIKAGKWRTFNGSETIVDGMKLVPLPGHTPGHTGYEFSSKGRG